MGGYVIHFMVYLLAMSGLICFALFIYKKVMTGTFNPKGAKLLSIEETMSINPRKSLMIVKAGEERFLIASDVDKTTLISKLNDNVSISSTKQKTSQVQFQNLVEEINSSKTAIKENADLENYSDRPAEKQPIHLEVITQKNPAAIGLNRKNSYTSRNYSGAKRSRSASAIRGLADKVNEGIL